MKFFTFLAVVVIAAIGIFTLTNKTPANDAEQVNDITTNTMQEQPANITIQPVEHASAVISWGDTVIYTDPVGDAELYSKYPRPNLVLLTDIHGDHLDTETLATVIDEHTAIVAPQAVVDQLPENIADRTVILENDEETQMLGFAVTAIPMYNIPESEDSFHTKGRGNGYVLGKDNTLLYVAGDTSGTPEMRALTNIDVALVPMNLPFTMDVEEAADAVIAFAPKQVYPYHYRGRDGLSDVSQFKTLVDAANKDIEVVLLDWYPNQ